MESETIEEIKSLTTEQQKEMFNKWKVYKDEGRINDEQFNKLVEKLQETVADPLKELAVEMKEKNSIEKLKIPTGAGAINYANSYKCFLNETELTANEDDQRKLGMSRLVQNLVRQHRKELNSSGAEQLEKYLGVQSPFLNAVQKTTTDSLGGYLVPTPTYNLLLDDLRKSGLYFSETTMIEMTSKTLKFPTIASNGHPAPSYTVEGAKKNVSNFTFGQIDLSLKKYACLIPWTDELMEDGIVDIEAIVRQFAVDYYGILFEDILFNGDAQINGIHDMTTTFVTGGNTFTLASTIDNLIDMVSALRATDLAGAKFYMSPSIWGAFHKVKASTSGVYLLDFNDIKNMTLLGFPVVLSDSMPALTASAVNTPFVVFGNLKKIIVGVRNGMTISIDTSNVASFVDQSDSNAVHYAFQENLTVIRLEKRTDMDCAFPLRLVQLRTAAA